MFLNVLNFDIILVLFIFFSNKKFKFVNLYDGLLCLN